MPKHRLDKKTIKRMAEAGIKAPAVVIREVMPFPFTMGRKALKRALKSLR